MAEFCLECWNKLNGEEDMPNKYAVSKYLDLCEECGQYKQVVIGYSWRYRIKQFLNKKK